MGAVGARCMKGCEGGKKEVGEENLEDILLNQPIKIEDDTNEHTHTNNVYKARSANTNRNTECECKYFKLIF